MRWKRRAWRIFPPRATTARWHTTTTSPNFSILSSTAPTSGEHLLNFDASGATTTTALPVNIPSMVPGEFVAIVVEWDQPYVTGAPNSGGATSQINLCILGVSGTDVIYDDNLNPVTCSGPNSLGADPVQVTYHRQPCDQRESQCSGKYRHRRGACRRHHARTHQSRGRG